MKYEPVDKKLDITSSILEYLEKTVSDNVDLEVYVMTWMSVDDNYLALTRDFVQEKFERKVIRPLTNPS